MTVYRILRQIVVDDTGNAADQKFKSRRSVVIIPDFSMKFEPFIELQGRLKVVIRQKAAVMKLLGRISVPSNRDNKTAIEPFLAGVSGWENVWQRRLDDTEFGTTRSHVGW